MHSSDCFQPHLFLCPEPRIESLCFGRHTDVVCIRCRLTKYPDVSFLLEKPEAKVTSGWNKAVIPQIIVTSASNEALIGSSGGQEQRTIHEETVLGPYARHRNPSTIDAYALQTKE